MTKRNPHHVRFTSVRGHRIRLAVAIGGTAFVFGMWFPYVVIR